MSSEPRASPLREPHPVTLRGCQMGEVARVQRIIELGADEYHGMVGGRWRDNGNDIVQGIVAGVAYRVAEVDGQVVGAAAIEPNDDVDVLRHLHVDEKFRGRGIGSALLGQSIGLSHRPVLVALWADAHETIRFFQQHGFFQVDAAHAAIALVRFWNLPVERHASKAVLRL